jgi:YD repeat-containing protein
MDVDFRGLRLRKTSASGDTMFHYDQSGKLLAETTPAGKAIKEYVWLGDMLIAVLQ